MTTPNQPPAAVPPAQPDPFRRAVLRGLGALLPPLLTIVIFLWVGNTVSRYVLTPLEGVVRHVLVEYASDIRPTDDFKNTPAEAGMTAELEGEIYTRTPDNLFVPSSVYDSVEDHLTRTESPPQSAKEYYAYYVNQTYLRPWIVIPLFLSVFVLLLSALGRFMAVGIGRFFWGQFEAIITRLPLVSNVYNSVKQVTDFLFSEPDLDITRIVAIEYPRKGVWTVAFVTGESLLDIESAANEPVLSVLIPTSPMPFTGFTVTVKKSETVDLNMTIDQAFQFVLSCGVVVPDDQIPRSISETEADSKAQKASVDSSKNVALPAPTEPPTT